MVPDWCRRKDFVDNILLMKTAIKSIFISIVPMRVGTDSLQVSAAINVLLQKLSMIFFSIIGLCELNVGVVHGVEQTPGEARIGVYCCSCTREGLLQM